MPGVVPVKLSAERSGGGSGTDGVWQPPSANARYTHRMRAAFEQAAGQRAGAAGAGEAPMGLSPGVNLVDMLRFQLVATQLFLQPEARQAEEARRLRLIAVGPRQRFADQRALQSLDALLEAEIVGRLPGGFGIAGGYLR